MKGGLESHGLSWRINYEMHFLADLLTVGVWVTSLSLNFFLGHLFLQGTEIFVRKIIVQKNLLFQKNLYVYFC